MARGSLAYVMRAMVNQRDERGIALIVVGRQQPCLLAAMNGNVFSFIDASVCEAGKLAVATTRLHTKNLLLNKMSASNFFLVDAYRQHVVPSFDVALGCW